MEYEVYMKISSRFKNSVNTREVYKVRKSLYGLKQSLRTWFDGFIRAMKNHGYT